MEVLVLQVFVSLLLVAGSLLLFGHSVRQRTHEHSDRLALAPLDDENDTVSVNVDESGKQGNQTKEPQPNRKG
jgi:hypothetical protein